MEAEAIDVAASKTQGEDGTVDALSASIRAATSPCA